MIKIGQKDTDEIKDENVLSKKHLILFPANFKHYLEVSNNPLRHTVESFMNLTALKIWSEDKTN